MNNIWPNFTKLLKEGDETLKVKSAYDGYVIDKSGIEHLDAISGIWNVSLGYSRSDITENIYEEMKKLPTTSLFGRSYELIEKYSERLLNHAPDFSRVFYSCGGSDAVETALKLSRLYNHHKGRNEKNKIGHFRNSYHGVSMGALQVMGEAPNRVGFNVGNSQSFMLPIPDFDGVSHESVLEKIKLQNVDTVAAIILEPIIGSGGIIPFSKEFLTKLRAFTEQNDILLIFDEVVTGFGRTGEMFIYQSKGVVPDMIVVAKSITAGYAPLGATLISKEIEELFLDKDYKFLHGYTNAGSVVGIAAADKVLDIYEEEKVLKNVVTTSEELFTFLEGLKAMYPEIIKDVRGEGLMIGVEVYDENDLEEEITALYRYVNKNRLVSRPAYHNTLVLLPMLNADEVYMNLLKEKLEKTFEEYAFEKETRKLIKL